MRLPRSVWVFVLAKVLFHLATTRLEHHRDELYFIAASKRLAFSYVDFQPVTPFLVRLVRTLAGESLLALRLIPTVAGAVVIVLVALLARELGGTRRAQSFAAFTALIVPTFIGMNAALNTITLEVPAWLLVTVLLAGLLRTNDRRLWIAVGAAIGLALLVKFTVLAYLFGLAVAILVTPLRSDLPTKWPWLGAAVALALIGPSLWWQATNGFPVVGFVSNQGTGGRVLGLSGRLGYIASLILLPTPIALFLFVPGFRRILSDQRFRAIGVTHAVALLVFLVASGKGYYAAPAFAVLFAAGTVVVVGRRDRVPRLLSAGLAFGLLISLPLVVPLVPLAILKDSKDLAQATEIGERIGWRELASDVKARVGALPKNERARAIFLGQNYTLPAAVEFYDGPPAVSGHNSAYLWWPYLPPDHVAVVIGFEQDLLESMYEDVERVGTVRNRHGVENYEWGKPIWIGRGPKLPTSAIRERVKVFTA